MTEQEFEDHVLRIKMNGFTVLPGMLTPDECDEAQSALESATRARPRSERAWELLIRCYVAQGDSELSVAVDAPGAYRAEVRVRPEHLRASLGSFADLAESDFVWIYSNAIYVTE